jgi:tellurite resistance protein TerC
LPFINGGEPVHVPEIPTLLSLGVIIVTLLITTAASLYKTRVLDRKGEADTLESDPRESGTLESGAVPVPPEGRSD